MANYNKFNGFVDGLCRAKIDLSSAPIKVLLTNTLPQATNTKYSDISGTELANGNGYTTGGQAVAGLSLANNAGTETLTAQDTTFTSQTGNMGPFRYIVYYDSASGYLIGWYDYGSQVTLNGVASETFLCHLNAPLLTLS